MKKTWPILIALCGEYGELEMGSKLFKMTIYDFSGSDTLLDA